LLVIIYRKQCDYETDYNKVGGILGDWCMKDPTPNPLV